MISKPPLSRQQAYDLVRAHNDEPADLNHYLESEAVMSALARRLGEDEETWGLLGLLHDVDWGATKADLAQHLTHAPQILREAGCGEDFIEAVLSHGYGTVCAGLQDRRRSQPVERALACAETVTGLIHAYALMRGSMEGMAVKGLRKKFKDRKFAAGVDRDIILECERLGLTLDEFLQLAIDAIREIAPEVGLEK